MAINDLQIPYPDFQMGQIIDPEQHDINNLYVQNKVNQVVTLLNQLTEVSATGSGAELISIKPIAPFVSTKVQAFLNEVLTRLKATTDGASGADFVASTTITGVTGTTVQAQLKSLKALFDAEKTRVTTAMSTETARVTTAMSTETTRVNALINTEILNVKALLSTERARIDALNTTVASHTSSITTLNTQMANHNHDTRYMTRAELTPYLQGGDTQVLVEVYNIMTADNGDGTFTYKDAQTDVSYVGQLGNNGEMIFDLRKSDYMLNQNHIKAIINDTLHRSVASGGLKELSSTQVSLTSPEAVGTEITFEYYHRIGVTGEHSVSYGTIIPPPGSGAVMWFKVVG